MLQQMLQAARLDRAFYTKLIFDDYATGNAVLVVTLVYASVDLVARLVLGRFNLLATVGAIVSGLIAWLLSSLAIWLMGTKALGGDARAQTLIRLTGFAHAPLLLLVIPRIVDLGAVRVVAVAGAALWFGAGLMVASQVGMSLDRNKALGSAAVGAAVWLVFGALYLI